MNEKFFRSATVSPADINESGSLELSFSSEMPYERSFGMEVLGHTDEEADFSFISSGQAPLLMNHNRDEVIGVVEAAGISDDKGRARVRFSKRAAAQEVLTDIQDGIMTNVSVGYQITELNEVKGEDGTGNTVRAHWRPFEVSIVSVPADATVGVGRSQSETNENEELPMTDEVKTDELEKAEVAPAVEVDVAGIQKEARKAELSRVRDIMAAGKQFGVADLADTFVKEGKSLSEFNVAVLGDLVEKREMSEKTAPAVIGLNEKEVKDYSVVRALRAQMLPNDAKAQEEAAFELEASRAAVTAGNPEARGVVVPYDVLARDQNVGTGTAGGNLVATNLLSGSFIEQLRNASVLPRVGATYLSGLVGNVAIPKQTSATTGYWVSTEGGAPTESQVAVGQVAMAPKTLGAFTDMTRQLIMQSTPSIEALVRSDIARVIALAIDEASLYGTGLSGQPEGIANTTGINSTTFAGAVPTFAELIAMETAVAVDNADLGSISYLTDATTRGGLKGLEQFTGSNAVWQNDEVNGYNAVASQQVTAGDVFFGNFSDLLVGLWGGLDLTVDPYTASTTGTVRIVALQSVDIAVRNAVSFCHSNDTP